MFALLCLFIAQTLAAASLNSPIDFQKSVILENCWGLQFILQHDCNLVLQNKNTLAVVWNAGVSGQCSRLSFQTDGHLVLYNQNQVVWKTDAFRDTNEGPFRMVLQTDANLVIYNKNSDVVWNSESNGMVVPCPTPPPAPSSPQAAADRLKNQVRRAMPLTVDPLRKFKRTRLQESKRRITVFPCSFLNQWQAAGRAKNYEESLALAGLAGIVNRDYPQLFLDRLSIDSHWLQETKSNWMKNADYQVFTEQSTHKLIQHVLNNHVTSGTLKVVLYGTSQAQQASSMVAATASGCRNWIPIAKRNAPGSLYRDLVLNGPKLQVALDLTTTTCQSKISCYQYALNTFGNEIATDTAAYYLDYFWVNFKPSNDPTQHTAMNLDYFISKKAFIFDLNSWDDEAPNDSPNQPVAADVNMLTSILKKIIARQGANKRFIHVGGFTPWFYKYTTSNQNSQTHQPVPSEWRYADILSQHNAYMDADAFAPNAMTNAAFYHHFELPTRLVSPNVPGRLYEQYAPGGKVTPKRYYAFLACDYDAAAWVNSQLLPHWQHPARGTLPISWVVNPVLVKRAPMMIKHMYDTVAPTDVITAEEGMGYVNPHGLFKITGQKSRQSGIPDADELFAAEQEHYYSRLSQTVSSYIINGDYGAELTQKAAQMYAQSSWDGMVLHGGTYRPPYLSLGAPVMSGISVVGGAGETELNENRDNFLTWMGAATNVAPEQPKFVAFRSVLTDPGYFTKLKNKFESVDPHAVLVDVVTLGYLARQHLGGNQGTRVSYTKDSLELIDYLSPGTQTVSLTYRNDAVGQTITPNTAALFVQTRKVDGTILYTGGFALQDSAPRGHIKVAVGSFPVPANMNGQRLIVHVELIWRDSVAFSSHGNPARIYSFQVRSSAPSCPAIYCPPPTPAPVVPTPAPVAPTPAPVVPTPGSPTPTPSKPTPVPSQPTPTQPPQTPVPATPVPRPPTPAAPTPVPTVPTPTSPTPPMAPTPVATQLSTTPVPNATPTLTATGSAASGATTPVVSSSTSTTKAINVTEVTSASSAMLSAALIAACITLAL